MRNNEDIGILVVDDNSYIISLISTILKKKQYTVLTANNGLQGLKMLRRYSAKIIDIIITDYQMPEMNGLDFIKKTKLLDDFKSIPVILLSQHNNLFFSCNNQEQLKIFDAIVHKNNLYKSLHKEVERLLISNDNG
jgi:CheY-like chemotaxis protein